MLTSRCTRQTVDRSKTASNYSSKLQWKPQPTFSASHQSMTSFACKPGEQSVTSKPVAKNMWPLTSAKQTLWKCPTRKGRGRSPRQNQNLKSYCHQSSASSDKSSWLLWARRHITFCQVSQANRSLITWILCPPSRKQTKWIWFLHPRRQAETLSLTSHPTAVDSSWPCDRSKKTLITFRKHDRLYKQ